MSESPQLSHILEEMRKLFLAQDEVMDETISIRFSRIDDATAILRTDAGVATTDYQKFLAVAEQLNLNIVTLVKVAGATFSGPAKTVTLDGQWSTAISTNTAPG